MSEIDEVYRGIFARYKVLVSLMFDGAITKSEYFDGIKQLRRDNANYFAHLQE